MVSVSYNCQSEIFKHFILEKRREIARRCPGIRAMHRKLPFHFGEVSLHHSPNAYKFRMDSVCLVVRKCTHPKDDLEELSIRFVNYYLNRQGTKVGQLILEWFINITKHLKPMTVEKLKVTDDNNFENFNFFLRGSKFLKELRIYGNSIFDTFKSDYLLNSEKVIVSYPRTRNKMAAIEHFVKVKHLVFEFFVLLDSYHSLAEEILTISRQNRSIGSIVDYAVRDYFNFMNYPSFGSIIKELKGRWTALSDRKCITVPMTHAELNVFIIPAVEASKSWTLRMEVMEIGTALDREN